MLRLSVVQLRILVAGGLMLPNQSAKALPRRQWPFQYSTGSRCFSRMAARVQLTDDKYKKDTASAAAGAVESVHSSLSTISASRSTMRCGNVQMIERLFGSLRCKTVLR